MPCENGQCQDGLWCRFDDEVLDYVCQAKVGQEGDCVNDTFLDSAGCLDGLFCTEQGDCQPPGGEGDPCNVHDRESCMESFWCSRQTALCVAAAAEGEPCNPGWGRSCAPGQCASDTPPCLS